MEKNWKQNYSRYKGFFLNIITLYNSKPNLKIYFELILSLTTIVVFSIFAIRPTILTIIEINNEIRSKESTLSKLERKIRDLRTASSVLQNESNSLSLLDQAVPNQAELENIISQIETIATSNNVTISGISSTDLVLKGDSSKVKRDNDVVSLPENAQELPLTISVTGEYQGLLSFSKSLEDFRRPFKIDSYSLSATKAVDDSQVLTLTIVARAPYLNLIENKNEK